MIRTFLLVVILSSAVFGFHLQSDQNVVARLCTTRIRQICQYVGMECRGNQRFDADQPHAVCDYPGTRTQGYRPQVIYNYIMSQRQTRG